MRRRRVFTGGRTVRRRLHNPRGWQQEPRPARRLRCPRGFTLHVRLPFPYFTQPFTLPELRPHASYTVRRVAPGASCRARCPLAPVTCRRRGGLPQQRQITRPRMHPRPGRSMHKQVAMPRALDSAALALVGTAPQNEHLFPDAHPICAPGGRGVRAACGRRSRRRRGHAGCAGGARGCL